MRLLLLETPDSAYATRLVDAADVAGLSVTFLDGIEAAPANAALIGIGPSVSDPLQIARQLRALGAQPLLVFFTGSTSGRNALRADLIRDPFVYPRWELVDVPEDVRQLSSRLGRIVANIQRQLHAAPGRGRRRARARSSTSLKRLAAKGDHYLAHFLAHTPDAILSTDEAGRVEAWNDAAHRLFGFKAEAVLGRTVEFLHGGDADGEQLADLVKDVLASGQAQQAQVTCATGKGHSTKIAASIAPIRGSQGSVLGVSVIARDDSEFQRVQDALREANRQKDEFLAIVSHELRTPLTSILGYTDMLMRGLSGPLAPLTNRYVGNVRSAGDRLLELVNSLLDYTRLEAGAERLALRPVDLPRVVTGAVQHCQGVARSKSIELRVAVDKGTPSRVQADEERLTHVVRNFLSNALKFTPEGGQVRVQVATHPDVADAIRVSFADSGIGMRQEQIEHVWERFYQGDASLTRSYGGMGLGLSIARHLVALHGGSVGAESRGPGCGSTFWFSLPRRQTA